MVAEPLAQAVGIVAGDTAMRVVVVDVASCLSCDASLAPFIDRARASESHIRIWLSHTPTKEQGAQLAAQRIPVTGVVAPSVLPLSRLPVVVWRDHSLRSQMAAPDASAHLGGR